MTLQELGTIMQERLPIKIIILNNGYLGMVRQWQELFFDRRYSQVHMENPDFVQICKGFQVAERIDARRSERWPAAHVGSQWPLPAEVMSTGRQRFPMIPSGAAVARFGCASC